MSRRWFAPEVVQTSAMDCGPAALKCLLEGLGRPVSYGRLREACQTDVDGTSIDSLELVAGQLGLLAEQVMIPGDHLPLDAAAALPCLAVVRHAELATHFVVVWRRVGPWLQVMDPSRGRRWVSVRAFATELYRHEQAVPADAWRAWAETPALTGPLHEQMVALGLSADAAQRLIGRALAEPGWFAIAALDASVRLCASLAAARGLQAGAEAERLARALFEQTCASGHDIYAVVPVQYWSVAPDAANRDPSEERLILRGAVLLKAPGLSQDADPAADPGLSPELAAALTERPASPFSMIADLLRQDGWIAPLALGGAMTLATCVLMVEALLFRGIFDISASLALPAQRLAAALALLAFGSILLVIETPLVLDAARIGRRLEARLRMALSAKLSRLNDRYFQSRPISDMADRSHSLHMVRSLPTAALQLVQSAVELGLTFAGVAWLDPARAWIAGLLVVGGTIIPLLVQPLLNERDLRVRNHGAALHGFYLDALLGLAPIRAHRAERSVARQHEGLLVEWSQALLGSVRVALASDGAQALLCTTLGGALLVSHFRHAGQVSGSDLLLVFWTLKLPALGARIAGLAHQYPAYRNTLLRLMEPLAAPEAPQAPPLEPRGRAGGPVAIGLQAGGVLAGGHEILRGVDLSIAAGEHVAIVGASGAGKSSLLGVLLGWHRLSEGRLLLDGEAAGAGAVEALRRETAWVDPSIQIWNRSLLENLEYACDAPALDRIGEVLEAAGLIRVAEALPRGLQSLLGEGGGLLSGGEGQRVRLGRALAMEAPRLVLLDEPFRGLDRGQRRELLAEARTWWRDTTLICVTHDVVETQGFGRVMVVEDGRIVEDGPPAQLDRPGSRYRALLEAERDVHRTLWRGEGWRRLVMDRARPEPAESLA